jgi:hypothetical protein
MLVYIRIISPGIFLAPGPCLLSPAWGAYFPILMLSFMQTGSSVPVTTGLSFGSFLFIHSFAQLSSFLHPSGRGGILSYLVLLYIVFSLVVPATIVLFGL